MLHTVDVACASVAHWFACCEKEEAKRELVARTFDLASAYRQVGLNAEGRQFAVCIHPSFQSGRKQMGGFSSSGVAIWGYKECA